MFKTYDSNGNEILDLKNHLLTSSTIRTQSLVLGEWNLNIADNIYEIGNYRYRPQPTDISNYHVIPTSFVKDTGNLGTYFGATDSTRLFDDAYDLEDNPTTILSTDEKIKFYYSLEDCFNRFRPRSGINKAVFGKYGHVANKNMAKRPRYYLADKTNIFKYWTSYRSEVENNNIKNLGVSNVQASPSTDGYYIDDAAPFVVYKSNIYANRIIVKMQTHIGEELEPPLANDPFVGDSHKAVPKKWRIDVLRESSAAGNPKIWDEAIVLNDYDIRDDGYVELVYGPTIPTEYQDIFVYVDTISDTSALPDIGINGYAYLVESTNEYNIWLDSISPNGGYQTFSAESTWQTIESLTSRVIPYAKDLVYTTETIPSYSLNDNFVHYRDFDLICGLRIVVDTMKIMGVPFDLIELSPRLCVDLSDKTTGFSIDKKASDLSETGLPSGDILASTGSLSIFDYDQAFDKNNNESIIQDISFKNLQFKFYQRILDVDGYDYLIPIKTMYSDGFPEENYSDRMLQINLRDLFFYFESTTAPTVFVRNKTLSYIICMLLDSIGFSNYAFKKTLNEKEPIIPNFYVSPDQSLATVLQNLAKSTQCSMFFDEENNFIVMTKNYMMPENTSDLVEKGRSTDITLSGSKDQVNAGVVENQTQTYSELNYQYGTSIANIVDIKSENHDVYNDGKVIFTPKYIQKNISDLEQASKLESDRTYTYQPVLLWELSSESSGSITKEDTNYSTGFSLSAVALNSKIKNTPPIVSNNTVSDNIINIGESVYWLNNYSGYLLANAEIIKYDAKQYIVTGIEGPVWISSESDREYYFSKIPYNGKMIPTGNIRIYSEVSYNEDGTLNSVTKHGRAQFGTTIAEHFPGIDSNSDWIKNTSGASNNFKYLNGKLNLVKVSDNSYQIFDATGNFIKNISLYSAGNSGTNIPAGKTVKTETYYEDDSNFARRNGIIKNFMSSAYITEIENKTSTQDVAGAVQASALVMTGTKNNARTEPINFISYSYKDLGRCHQIVGTRMRIMGQKIKNEVFVQNPVGSMNYFDATDVAITDKKTLSFSISGASGGMAIFLNPETNAGYYLEIAALATYLSENDSNVWFYKLKSKGLPTITDKASPKLNAVIDATNPNILLGSSVGTINTSAITGTLAVGDRIKVSNLDKQRNGYYIVRVIGDASTAFKLERDELAIPETLWSGKTEIITDYTGMVGSSRISPDDNTPIYDLKIKWEDLDNNSIRFYLYVNDNLIGSYIDKTPETKTNFAGLFIRGTSKCMFEHVYAISTNYNNGNNQSIKGILDDSPKIFDLDKISLSNSFRAYRLNEEMITNYLSTKDSAGFNNDLYFEEFGTILRECAYFNIRYDKAYPALLSNIANTYNPLLGYYVSNFRPNPYGAEFMVFNTTDSPLAMNSSTGNYLRINGVAFTAESKNELTVDEYFNKVADYSHYQFTTLPENATNAKNDSILIKNSRITYGKKDFSLEAPYIQDRDTAYEMMSWMIQKIKKPKIAIGVEVFGLPIIQLGDIVQVDYSTTYVKNNQLNESVQIPADSRFVVYAINHTVNEEGPSHTLYLSEVS